MNHKIQYPITQGFLDNTQKLSFWHNQITLSESDENTEKQVLEYESYSNNHVKGISSEIYFEIEECKLSEPSILRILNDFKEMLKWYEHFSAINQKITKTKEYKCSELHFTIYKKSSEIVLFELFNVVNSISKLINPVTQEQKEEKTNIEEPFPILELNKVSHKIVLLHSLGIIDFLKEKNEILKNNTKLSSLIVSLMGLTDKDSGNIRKSLSHLGNGTEKDPINTKSLQTVKSELIKIGIEI